MCISVYVYKNILNPLNYLKTKLGVDVNLLRRKFRVSSQQLTSKPLRLTNRPSYLPDIQKGRYEVFIVKIVVSKTIRDSLVDLYKLISFVNSSTKE